MHHTRNGTGLHSSLGGMVASNLCPQEVDVFVQMVQDPVVQVSNNANPDWVFDA